MGESKGAAGSADGASAGADRFGDDPDPQQQRLGFPAQHLQHRPVIATDCVSSPNQDSHVRSLANLARLTTLASSKDILACL